MRAGRRRPAEEMLVEFAKLERADEMITNANIPACASLPALRAALGEMVANVTLPAVAAFQIVLRVLQVVKECSAVQARSCSTWSLRSVEVQERKRADAAARRTELAAEAAAEAETARRTAALEAVRCGEASQSANCKC